MLPSTKTGVQKVETLTEKYILLDYNYLYSGEKSSIISYSRNMCRQNYYTLLLKSIYRTSWSHNTYLIINNMFFIPNLIHYLQSYIKGCYVCQLPCNEKPPTRQLQTRINLSYTPLSRLSMDLKVMPRSYQGHKGYSGAVHCPQVC